MENVTPASSYSAGGIIMLWSYTATRNLDVCERKRGLEWSRGVVSLATNDFRRREVSD